MQFLFHKALKPYSVYGVTLALASLLVLAGCSNFQASSELTDDDTALNDEMKAIVVKRAIAMDPRLPYEEISVLADKDGHEIVLGGMVPSQQMKEKAAEIARESNPNTKVVNDIKVIPDAGGRKDFTNELAAAARKDALAFGDRVGNSLEDAWIYSKIKSKLVLDHDTPAHSINVDVEDGHVTLRGNVFDAYAQREADEIARSTEGVKSVDDQLLVDRTKDYALR